MRWDSGALLVGRWRGTPVYLSWTLPIGMWLFGGQTVVGALAVALLVFVHEVGHAILIRARGLAPVHIRLHGAGGECAFDGSRATPLDHAVIAWGGVLAQSVVFVLALAGDVYLVATPTPLLVDLLNVLGGTNALMIAFNLLPVAGLDGERAWSLLPLGWSLARTRYRTRRDARLAQKRSVAARAARRGLRVVDGDRR